MNSRTNKSVKKCCHLLLILFWSFSVSGQNVWSVERIEKWYMEQPWLVGSNYVPANAINQLEMFQAETFDLSTIDRELGWAAGMGMNTMRVFLHDLLWKQDAEGFKKRIGQFLDVCAKHEIKPLVVFFDSCWDPYPKLGKQPEPRKGIHNSGWVQSPGARLLADTTQYPMLREYVLDIVGAFRNDERILAWDVWNEPDNESRQYAAVELKDKVAYVEKLLPQVFSWVREARPSQPLTSGLWSGFAWAKHKELSRTERIQVDHSDFISFHSYGNEDDLSKRIKALQNYGRPLMCTEYMARTSNSTFQNNLPVLKRFHVAAFNWGFVSGKSNTIYPWDSWKKTYEDEPEIWFHDILRLNGQPFDEEEVKLIKSLTRQP